MESFGNEKRIQQGEDWNLDLLVTNGNVDEPYIVSSELVNPFFVVTVASTKYEKNERYVKSWWNSIKDSKIPTFYDTNAIDCGELQEDEELPTIPGQDTFATFTNGDSIEKRYLYRYTKSIEEKDAELGRKPYHYFYFVYDAEIQWESIYVSNKIYGMSISGTNDTNWWFELQDLNTSVIPKENDYVLYTGETTTMNQSTVKKGYLLKVIGVNLNDNKVFVEITDNSEVIRRVDNYSCPISFNFLSKDTAEWTGQNYIYQITLVSGQLIEDTIEEIYDYHKTIGDDLSDWPVKTKELTDLEYIELEYNYIKTRWPDSFQVDIDSDSPLGYIETPIPILRPTKIEVMNNLRRLI